VAFKTPTPGVGGTRCFWPKYGGERRKTLIKTKARSDRSRFFLRSRCTIGIFRLKDNLIIRIFTKIRNGRPSKLFRTRRYTLPTRRNWISNYSLIYFNHPSDPLRRKKKNRTRRRNIRTYTYINGVHFISYTIQREPSVPKFSDFFARAKTIKKFNYRARTRRVRE